MWLCCCCTHACWLLHTGHSAHLPCMASFGCAPLLGAKSSYILHARSHPAASHPCGPLPGHPRPPLVTALRAGHSREVISLLVEPVVKHREGRRQDIAVEGLLDDRGTRW